MPARRKPPSRVAPAPTLSLSVVLFGVVAVVAAAAALVRDHERRRVRERASDDAATEIVAPELEIEPALPTGSARP
jgi:hypothetical protein